MLSVFGPRNSAKVLMVKANAGTWTNPPIILSVSFLLLQLYRTYTGFYCSLQFQRAGRYHGEDHMVSWQGQKAGWSHVQK